MVLSDGIEACGTSNDFLGHVSADDFIIITRADLAQSIKQHITDRFRNEVGTFYSFRDRERGYIQLKDGAGGEKQVPLMTLAVGVVNSKTAHFADIREITEIAAAERRKHSES